MKKIIMITMSIIALSGCASNRHTDSPTEFETGKEVKPPYGCIELRKERKDANC